MTANVAEPVLDVRVPDKPRVEARPRRFTRRAFLVRLCGGGILGGGAAAAYAHYVEPFWPAIERHEMDFPGLDAELTGLRVMQLSDLHLSRSVPVNYLREQLQRCQSLGPDLILITGDFITAGDGYWIEPLMSLLAPLHAPLGVFAILGNHDFGVYSPFRIARGRGIADHIQRAVESSGLTVLRNESQVVTRNGAALQLVGIDDRWGGFSDPDAAFADADPGLPTIALTHNPDTVPELGKHPYHWVLCGHTHGGQVRIPLLGAPLLPVENRQWDAGRFDVDGRRLYVNRGLGSLHQVRFNCRPEITLFTLVRRS